MSENNYPRLMARVKAVVVDAIVLLLILLSTSALFSNFESVPHAIRIAVFIFAFGLYDPILTSQFGGTIGHRIIGLRVKKESEEGKNISLPLAILRFFCKTCFGWVSLLTVTGNEKRQAIHDIIVRSVVVDNR